MTRLAAILPQLIMTSHLKRDIPLEKQAIVLDVFDENCEKVGTKQILTTWINDRDQFYQPFSDNLPQEFVNDCVIWSAFAPSNNSAALKDVLYQGKTYQIENHLFPFLLSDVVAWKCGLSDISAQLFSANEDRFMAKWINNASLSKEANDVLTAAKKLYQCVYQNIGSIRWLEYKIQLWDMGWWQVREAAKQIVSAKPLYEALRQAEAVLSAKIESQIDGLGFMAPAEQPLD